MEKAEALVRENSFVEFRLDYLSRPGTVFPALKDFLHTHPFVLAIATCRRVPGGGKFRGSVRSELDVLLKAAELGCPLVDVELASAKRM